MSSVSPPPGPLSLTAIHPKIKAAALAGGVFAVGTLLTLYATGGLTLKAAILAVTGPLVAVAGGYLKSS
jgi:hypothetical protein